jgi:hypothetical protein
MLNVGSAVNLLRLNPHSKIPNNCF